MKTMSLFKMLALMMGLMICNLSGWGQTNPAPQSLPFEQDFSTFNGSQTVYPVGIQGWTIAGSTSTSYPTTAPNGNHALAGGSNSSTSAGVFDMNGKIGMLNTGSALRSIVIALNTSNLVTINVTYIAATQRQEAGARIGAIGLQYRLGTSGTFTNIAGTEYQNQGGTHNTSGTSSLNPQTISITLPAACENIPVVQLRWVYREVSGSGNRPSFSIDNIVITGTPLTIPAVATPTFNPPAGTYYSTQNIAISTLTEGATIYYTTDGTDPNELSTLYTSPVVLSESKTLKARAYKAGYDPSAIATSVYVFPEIIPVNNIAALRAGIADGITGYKLTGEAILKAQDGFNNRKFIEDITAAILIFDTPGIITGTYNLGDGLTNITGVLTTVANMLRFVPVLNAGPASSTGNPVLPTVFGINELTSSDQAKLVKLENVTFTTTGNFANGQNYTITDGTNNMILRTDFWNVNYIGTPIPTVAQDITGVIIQFNANLQIVPRFLADFENTVIAVAPPAAFAAATAGVNQINLTFTTNAANDDVVIVFNETGIFSDPSGTPPVLGAPFAGGTLLYVGKTSPQLHSGLNAATTYYYKAWSVAGTNYSTGLTANAAIFASEPVGHATEFIATTNSSSSITVAWQDSDAESYLVKASNLSFNNIAAPVDGTPEANSILAKNVASGIKEVEFTNLTASTAYFFRIYPYNGSGAVINYKTDGVVPEASATTHVGPALPVQITQWDFEADPLLPNTTNPAPSFGTGVASAIGAMGTLSRATGTATGCSATTGTGAWAFGAVNPGTNESSGAQFMVPTTGYNNITFAYDQRFSNTATRTVRIQYTLNGTTWINFDVTGANYTSGCTDRGGIDIGRIDISDPVGNNVAEGWSRRTIDFSEIPGINNNPDFGVRIVAAHYANTGQFRQANNVGAVATGGAWRFDNVSFSGYAMPVGQPVKLAITDINGGLSPTINLPFELNVQSQNQDGMPAAVTQATQVTLTLATGTGMLGGTLVGTILSGQNNIIFSNVTYSAAETGVSITASATAGMTLTPATSTTFEVISPATHLAFAGLAPYGIRNIAIPSFTVEARKVDNLPDPNFTGIITISKLSGTGELSGTLAVNAVAGIGTFSNVIFDTPGAYKLVANATGLTQGISTAIEIVGDPVISGVIVPRFMGGNAPGNDRLPFAFRASIGGLMPNSTYRFINQVVVSSDSPTTGGAGNPIFVNQQGSFLRTTATGFTTVGQYYEFNSDETGNYTGWFMVEPTTNVRFTPGNGVFMRLRINNGAGGTTVAHYLTINQEITILGFGITADTIRGTAVRAISVATPRDFAVLYDLESGSGRPLYATSIEQVGIDFSAIATYAAFYRNNVSGISGAWGAIIPNVNANGVRRIEERRLTDGSLVKTHTSNNGIWVTTNTVNPSGGTTELVIDLTVPVVPENRTVNAINLGNADVACFDATNNITVTNTSIGSGASAEFRAGVNIIFGDGFIAQEGSYVLAIITDVYCTLPPAMLASEGVVIPAEIPVIEGTESMFRAYPNPTSGNLTLEISGTEASSKVLAELYNMMGNRMIQQEISGAGAYTIDLSAMPRGVYILRVIIDGKTEMQKIIRQ